MLNHRTLGIIFANMHDNVVGEMTAQRSMASLPFGGRYRMIDFYLSALVDAGVSKVGIVTKSNYQSLMDHIGSGRDWDLARKEGISILPPFSYANANSSGIAYHGRIEALYNIRDYIERSKVEYVAMMDADYVWSPDIAAIVNDHAASGADVTMVCRAASPSADELRNCVMVRAGADGRVTEMMLNRFGDGFLQSMNLFVVGKEALLSLIEDSMARMKTMFERDVLQANLGTLHVHCCRFEGWARHITSLKSYFDASLALIDPASIDALFRPRRIYTKVHDSPPVRYGLACHAADSVIADGCIIEGVVDHCVLFRGVHIRPDAVVRNCVLLQNTVVGEGAHLESVITDKDVAVTAGTALAGSPSYPFYVQKRSTV